MRTEQDVQEFLRQRFGSNNAQAYVFMSALFLDYGTPATVISDQGEFLGCNPASRMLMLGEDRLLQGATLFDVLPRAFAKERLGYVRNVIEARTPMRVKSVIRGRSYHCCMRPFPPDADLMVLVVSTPSHCMLGRCTGADIIEATEKDWGPLAALTPREREILGLLGAGLSIGAIASHLHRGVKTIETHRTAIGRKLKVRTRTHLTQIAMIAGLCEPPNEIAPHPIDRI